MKNLVLLIVLIFISLCIQSNTNQNFNQQAESDCINLCKAALDSGQNLSNSPCLSDNNSNWIIDDWVCDVAHSPRQSVDNLPENQCSAFRSGQAHHFVEVDTNCNLIRVV